MAFMLGSEVMEFIWSVNLTEVIGPFAVLAVIILFALLWYAREGRNGALENILVQKEFGPPAAFHGSLIVEESQPGNSLRLCKSTTAARWLQFRYRWFAVGKQAIFDEVTFDGSRCLVEMKKGNKKTTAGFSEFSAIRMREVSGGRGGGSLWHVELVPHGSKAIPFVTSEIDSRKTAFEKTALGRKSGFCNHGASSASIRCREHLDAGLATKGINRFKVPVSRYRKSPVPVLHS